MLHGCDRYEISQRRTWIFCVVSFPVNSLWELGRGSVLWTAWALKDLVTKCRHCSRPVKSLVSFKAELHMEKYWLFSYRISAFWMNSCLKWQTYYWSTVILYKYHLHCSYFDNEKRYLAATIFILPWRTGNNKSFLNYFNYWAKCFRIKKNVSWYVENITSALHFSKINIIVFLLFHHNSIKIILCYKAEIKH